ncbi:sugar ABC transporter permease [Prochlorococcus sp. MIT 1300]|uniref:carbohydrate ABC transporter permease n=1 Tax=Prochlorococcus sp. MIT 1300 TaxID=3096218 RepID=UPI002A74B23F|nr:sugar ABC transporter permease [Prochlorococcus sp. MIT 1300]
MLIALLLPSVIFVILFFGVPLLHYSLLSLNANSVITGLKSIPNQGGNWIRLLNDDRFWLDAFQTFRFASLSVAIEIVLALSIALLLNQKWRGRDYIRTITLLPWALPTTIMALGWRWIFNTPYGPIEKLASYLGIQHLNILSNPDVTWMATIVADVWKTTPFIAVILLAGLQTIPTDIYEAFLLEGGNPRQALFQITLPLLKPYLLIAILFRLAQAFGVFDLIQVMTGGGPASSTESIAMYAYINAMRFLDFGYSATIVMGGFLLLLILCILAIVLYIQLSNSLNRIL